MKEKKDKKNKDYNRCKNSIREAIRKSFSRSDIYKNFLKSKRVEWKEKVVSDKFKVSLRKRVSYRCNLCKDLFSAKQINVDHIEPIGRGVLGSIEDTHLYYTLVYCSEDNLQILCKDKCHKEKTKRENAAPSFDNAEF